MYDYFYGAEAEQFSFYRIPKVLFTEERFRSVSAEAKVLYGLLLDRMSLSCKNGWLDQAGRVYIIFTIDEVMTALGCADQKAGKLLHELESKCRLIERKRQGLGKPNLIYVKNFVEKDADNPVDNASGSTTPSPESRFQNRENHDSGAVKITDQESLKSRGSYTDKNDTVFLFYTLCCPRNKQVVSQPACLYFMVQFQYVKSHTYKIPFYHNIGIASGQERRKFMSSLTMANTPSAWMERLIRSRIPSSVEIFFSIASRCWMKYLETFSRFLRSSSGVLSVFF